MSRCFKLLGIIALPVLVWGVTSWYFNKLASEALDQFIVGWPTAPTQYLADLEVIDTTKGLFNSSQTIRFTPNVPYLIEQLGDLTLGVRQVSGPVFIDDSGISFGKAKWLLSIRNDENIELESNINVKLSLAQQLLVSGAFEKLHTQWWSVKGMDIKGVIDLDTYEYQFSTFTDELEAFFHGWKINFSSPSLVMRFKSMNNGEAVNITQIGLNADNGYFLAGKDGKKTPLTLSSNGSIWEKNGTLDADLEASLTDSLPLNNKEAYVSIQVRQWLSSGVIAYLEKLSSSGDYLRQSEWALEEVETPEQQDFYRFLRDKSEEASRLSFGDLISPMLKEQQSQFALDAGIKKADNNLGFLRLAGTASASLGTKPQLPMTGELNISAKDLDSNLQQLLKRWTEKSLLREYETAFESDISVKMQELLLNNRHISLVHLNAELKQTLVDQ